LRAVNRPLISFPGQHIILKALPVTTL